MGLLSKASSADIYSDEEGGIEHLDSLGSLDSIESKISYIKNAYNILNCIIFSTQKKGKISEKLQGIINRNGTVIPLESGNSLVLLKGSIDRELICHRLSNSLNIKPLMSFETSKIESLMKHIGKV